MKPNIQHSRGCKIINADKPETMGITACNCGKLSVFDWLDNLPESSVNTDIVEVQFKNTRKAYFQNVNGLPLCKGDMIAVEASPGHDIGIVSLTGELVLYQMRKNKINIDTYELKKVYRKVKPVDVQKWSEAISLEHYTMVKTREIAEKLKLGMKIGDVEYQGDGTKAIFYYIADERVDFRELIKILAEVFKIKVEMKQIGARQEAGKIGGIGTCGRELCCSTWVSSFVSVSTTAARDQDLSLNPQKLAGQCSKLKCCLNYEHDAYLDVLKNLPNTSIELITKDGTAYFQKNDVLRRVMWYSFERHSTMNMTPISVERVKEIIELNKQGIKVDKLIRDDSPEKLEEAKKESEKIDFENHIGHDSITRFDSSKKKSNNNHHRNKNKKRNVIN